VIFPARVSCVFFFVAFSSAGAALWAFSYSASSFASLASASAVDSHSTHSAISSASYNLSSSSSTTYVFIESDAS